MKALVTFLAVVLGAGPALAAPQSRATVPTLAWEDCGDGVHECTPAQVPLDYRYPGGTQLTLQLRRWKAADPDARIGTLFIYAGGPGSSGWDWVRSFATSATQEIRDRFDIVGFDPRGVHRSQPVVAAEFPLTGPGMAYGPPAYDQTHAPACLQWAAARLSRYTGSYRAHGSAAILVSGNTGDPDTPYADSVALARTLENGHLITWQGEGHTARRKSACVERYMYEYLLREVVPPEGTVCRDAPIPD
ncbi:alpha/beta hydrolase [Actinoplanes sp. CA-142083]|uniref:alpha/beta hydrolase n=1 Tax=Actinoplanes sp. CA-142083 TaxID=3239903 RepID=UPI003D8CCC35